MPLPSTKPLAHWENVGNGKSLFTNMGIRGSRKQVRTDETANRTFRNNFEKGVSHANLDSSHILLAFHKKSVMNRIGDQAAIIEAAGAKYQTLQHNEKGFGSGYAL